MAATTRDGAVGVFLNVGSCLAYSGVPSTWTFDACYIPLGLGCHSESTAQTSKELGTEYRLLLNPEIVIQWHNWVNHGCYLTPGNPQEPCWVPLCLKIVHKQLVPNTSLLSVTAPLRPVTAPLRSYSEKTGSGFRPLLNHPQTVVS